MHSFCWPICTRVTLNNSIVEIASSMFICKTTSGTENKHKCIISFQFIPKAYPNYKKKQWICNSTQFWIDTFLLNNIVEINSCTAQWLYSMKYSNWGNLTLLFIQRLLISAKYLRKNTFTYKSMWFCSR